MKILIVNDDGITSENLQILCESASARGHLVRVCAPATQQSAKSHSFTIFEGVMAERKTVPGSEISYAIHGTPVDCTRIGLLGYFPDTDLVISGINHGYNHGLATYVSGTVGAAREAAFQGKRAMAVSTGYTTAQESVRFFADWIVTLAEYYMEHPGPAGAVLNVNFPSVSVSELMGAVMCPISTHVYIDSYVKYVDPRGRDFFFLRDEEPDPSPTEGCDVDMTNKGYITCSFLCSNSQTEYVDADYLKDL